MSTTQRHVLVLAYAFPPLNYAGSHRLRHFVRAFVAAGWRCTVVTIKEAYAGPKDGKILESIPKGVTIIRTNTFDPFEIQNRILSGSDSRAQGKPSRPSKLLVVLGKVYQFFVRCFFFPDEQMFWRWIAYPVVRKAMGEQRPDVIFSSSLPNTAHLLAQKLAKELAIPFCVDFRDEWSQNEYRKPLTSFHAWLHRAAERSVLEHAALVTSTTEGITRQLQSLAPKSRAQFHTIYNGYDESADTTTTPAADHQNIFRIVHTGNFYGERTPREFLEALHECIEQGSIDPKKVELLFAGAKEFRDQSSLDAYSSIAPLLKMRGYIPMAESLALQKSATLLLLVQDGTHIPSKLFEYLQSCRPILAITPGNGETARILRATTQAGVWVCEPGNADAIRTAILDAYSRWAAHGTIAVEYRAGEREQYSRSRQSAKLVQYIEACLQPRS